MDQLIPLSEHYLDMILVWRNQPEVRQMSLNDHEISIEEHYKWWERIKEDSSKQWLIYADNEKNCGVVNFYDIKPLIEAYWGFYLSNQLLKEETLKYWFAMEKAATQYAFETLKIKSLKCEIFRSNKAALIMHKKSGYREIDAYKHQRGEVVVLELQPDWVK